MTIEHDTVTALISLVGPADVWFGVGLDASAMADKPYAIIVDGSGRSSHCIATTLLRRDVVTS